jgi:hypothetical protein
LWQGTVHEELAKLAAKELFVVLNEQAEDTPLQQARPPGGTRRISIFGFIGISCGNYTGM